MTPTPFTSIVCSVDFSDHSVQALRYAIALAGHFGSRVSVVHVADPFLLQAAIASYDVTGINEDTETALRVIADEIAKEGGASAPEIRTIVSVGDPATEIVAIAEEVAADLIVMGTHGRTGYRKMFFGSVTENVLRLSPVPVFAVPASDRERVAFTSQGPRFSFGPVLAPIDLGARSLINARVAQSLSATFGVPLLLVHVIESILVIGARHQSVDAHKRAVVADARDRLRTLSSELAPTEPVETRLAAGSPAAQIAAVAAERDAGLIVLGLPAQAQSRDLRRRSVAYGVLCLVKVPVLAIPWRFHVSARVRAQGSGASVTSRGPAAWVQRTVTANEPEDVEADDNLGEFDGVVGRTDLRRNRRNQRHTAPGPSGRSVH